MTEMLLKIYKSLPDPVKKKYKKLIDREHKCSKSLIRFFIIRNFSLKRS